MPGVRQTFNSALRTPKSSFGRGGISTAPMTTDGARSTPMAKTGFGTPLAPQTLSRDGTPVAKPLAPGTRQIWGSGQTNTRAGAIGNTIIQPVAKPVVKPVVVPPKITPTPVSQNTAGSILGQFTGGKTAANPTTPFELLLPYQQYMQALKLDQIAANRINPEEQYNATRNMNQFDASRANSGNYRTGNYAANRAELGTGLNRQRLERISNYQGALEDQFTNQYKLLADRYWKDPNLDVAGAIKPLGINVSGPTVAGKSILGMGAAPTDPTKASQYSNIINGAMSQLYTKNADGTQTRNNNWQPYFDLMNLQNQ